MTVEELLKNRRDEILDAVASVVFVVAAFTVLSPVLLAGHLCDLHADSKRTF